MAPLLQKGINEQSLRNCFHDEVSTSKRCEIILRMRPPLRLRYEGGRGFPLATLRMRNTVTYLQKGTTKSPTLRMMEGWKEMLRGLGSGRERSSELSKCVRDSHITIAVTFERNNVIVNLTVTKCPKNIHHL